MKKKKKSMIAVTEVSAAVMISFLYTPAGNKAGTGFPVTGPLSQDLVITTF